MNKTIKALCLALPALIIISFIYIGVNFAYTQVIRENAIANILISDTTLTDTVFDDEITMPVNDLDLPDGIVETSETIPTIAYASQWATLNINGWETKDIPVYLGDKDDILSYGAGQWIGSYFCGLGKNCIIRANVATWFYELEDTAIGTSVIMQTIYGDYEYEVSDKYTFYSSDIDILYDELGEDTLILHTSYPRSSSSEDSNKRIALICTLKNGKLYADKYYN